MKKTALTLILTISALIFLSTCKKEAEVKIELPTISTLEVTEVTINSAKSGGNITNDGGGDIIARGIVWSISQNPTFEQHIGLTLEGVGAGLFQSLLTGLTQYTTYYVRAYAANSAGIAYGSQVQFTTESITVQPCPGAPTVTDIDGNVYNTVLIGNQCWMKENLSTTKYRNGEPIEYPGENNTAWDNNTTGAYAWEDNDINWKDSYGALYNWHAVNNANGLCPTGWHVPSDAEWTQLVHYVAAQGFPSIWENPNGVGNALKSCRQVNSPLGGDCNTSEHPRWNSHDIHHGFDEFGFSALPGGYRHSLGSFNYLGAHGNWWSSKEHSSLHAWSRFMGYHWGHVSRHFIKTAGFSVRCLRDN